MTRENSQCSLACIYTLVIYTTVLATKLQARCCQRASCPEPFLRAALGLKASALYSSSGKLLCMRL